MSLNGDNVASSIVLRQATRVREIVEKSDYAKCPVGHQKDVNLFMIDGITAIIEQQSTVKVTTWISGATGGGIGAGIAALIFYTGRFHHWW